MQSVVTKLFESLDLSKLEETLSDILLDVSDMGYGFDFKLIRHNMAGDPLPGIIQIKYSEEVSDQVVLSSFDTNGDSDITFTLDDIREPLLRINDILPLYHVNLHLRATQVTDTTYQERHHIKYRETPFLHKEIDENYKFEDIFTDSEVVNQINEYGLLSVAFFINPEIVRSL